MVSSPRSTALLCVLAAPIACNALFDISEHELASPDQEDASGAPGSGGAGGAAGSNSVGGEGPTHPHEGEGGGGGESDETGITSGAGGDAKSGGGGNAGEDSASGSGGAADSAGAAGSPHAGGGSNTCIETCLGGRTCRSGVCTCPSNKPHACNNRCVDWTDNRDNCGSCNRACGEGAICQNGECTCSAGTPDPCGDACVDFDIDGNNCGSCGHRCEGQCADGKCKPVVLARSASPWGLAVNKSGVYWLERAAVLGVSLAGGGAATLASGALVSGPGAIAATDTKVYYTNTDNSSSVVNYQYAVMQVPLNSSANVSEFGSPASDLNQPWGVAVSAGTVYWLDQRRQCIFKAPANAGRENPDSVYCGTTDGYNYHGFVAVDENNAYWGVNDGGIFQAALSGSGPLITTKEVGASGSPLVAQIAVRAGVVYYTTGTPTRPAFDTPRYSSVSMVTAGGGGTVTLIASGSSVTPALAVDATGVYWSDDNINRTPLEGGSATVLAPSQSAGFLALDEEFVYFTDATSGTVGKITKEDAPQEAHRTSIHEEQ